MICSTVHMTLFVMRRCNEFTERDKSGTIEINEISRISPMMESDKRIGCTPKLKFHIDVYLHGNDMTACPHACVVTKKNLRGLHVYREKNVFHEFHNAYTQAG